MPLTFVILRYFAYIVGGLGALWLAVFTLFAATINLGWVYPANYGAAHAAETAEALGSAPAFDAAAVPTAYRYAVIDTAGSIAQTNMSDDLLNRAADAARSASATQSVTASAEVTGSDGVTYAVAPRSDGGAIVLASTYLPQFRDPALRDALPNPQNLMLAAGCVGSVAVVALVARRASRVLAHKMAPLTAAAERIAHEDLDHAVGRSNVREIDDVLVAMDRMRGSLAESLEARWRAEREQREQVAALAHDLKTPLTVLRANADYLAEELDGTGALDAGAQDAVALDTGAHRTSAYDTNARDTGEQPGTPAPAPNGEPRTDLADAARDSARACDRLDAYIRLLIELSRGSRSNEHRQTSLADVLQAVEDEARPLARARGLSLTVHAGHTARTATVRMDEPAVVRALMNLVANACDHAQSSVTLALACDDAMATFTVEDDGPGFSPAALDHGCERFFTDNAARHTGTEAHYGIGLAMAADVARAHGGRIKLANRTDAAGATCGARASLTLPRQSPAAPSW